MFPISSPTPTWTSPPQRFPNLDPVVAPRRDSFDYHTATSSAGGAVSGIPQLPTNFFHLPAEQQLTLLRWQQSSEPQDPRRSTDVVGIAAAHQPTSASLNPSTPIASRRVDRNSFEHAPEDLLVRTPSMHTTDVHHNHDVVTGSSESATRSVNRPQPMTQRSQSRHVTSASITQEDAVMYKMRLQDRDDMVRDLTRRIVELEAENEALRDQLAEQTARQRSRKTTGTNTTGEWVAEQMHREHLMAAETFQRHSITLLHAEWFALALAANRQAAHSLRLEEGLRSVLNQAATQLAATQKPSTLRKVVPSGGASGGTAHVSSGGLISSHTSTVGFVTPSSATGTALHILRQLDTSESLMMHRALNAIAQQLSSAQHAFRDSYRHSSDTATRLSLVCVDEADDRRSMVECSTEGLVALHHEHLVRGLKLQQRRIYDALSRDNHRMAEFAVAEAAAAHEAKLALTAERASLRESLAAEQVNAFVGEEKSCRSLLHNAENDARHTLMTSVRDVWCDGAACIRVVDSMQLSLESGSVSLRHSDEPLFRIAIQDDEEQQRRMLRLLRGYFTEHLSEYQLASLRRTWRHWADDAVEQHDALSLTYLRVHRDHLMQYQEFLSLTLPGSLRQQLTRTFGIFRQQVDVMRAEEDSRRALTDAATASLLQMTAVHTSQVVHCEAIENFATAVIVGGRMSGGWSSEGQDAPTDQQQRYGAAATVTLRNHHQRSSSSFLLDFNASQRGCFLELIAGWQSTVQAASQHLAALCEWKLRWQRSWFRRVDDLSSHESAYRRYVAETESDAWWKSVVLPFVLGLRELEMDREFSDHVGDVEKATYDIVARFQRREVAHVGFVGDVLLLWAHFQFGNTLVDLHEALLLQGWGRFINHDVRRAERRLSERMRGTLDQSLTQFSRDVSDELRGVRVDAVAHVEVVRGACDAHWTAVRAADWRRTRDAWMTFASKGILQEWYTAIQRDVVNLMGHLHQQWHELHGSAQMELLRYSLAGPAVELVGAVQRSAAELVEGMKVSTSLLQLGCAESAVAARSRHKELASLQQFRHDQEVSALERRFRDCYASLETETRRSEGLRLVLVLCNTEAAHRSNLMHMESSQRWDRCGRMMKSLTQISLAPITTYSSQPLSHSVSFVAHPIQRNDDDVARDATAASRMRAAVQPLVGSSPSQTLDGPRRAISMPSLSPPRTVDSTASPPPIFVNSAARPVTGSSGAQASHRRSVSDDSSIAESELISGAPDDLTSPPAGDFVAALAEARARRSSFVSSRSQERRMALRDTSANPSGDALPQEASDVVPSLSRGASVLQRTSVSPDDGRTSSGSSPFPIGRRRSLTAWSPSPDSRRSMLRDYHAKIEQQFTQL